MANKTTNAFVNSADVKMTSIEKAMARQNEIVTIKLFKDNGKYKDDVFVEVNDKTFQIQRGVNVKVPRYVADILKQSEKQDQSTATWIQTLEKEYQDKLDKA